MKLTLRLTFLSLLFAFCLYHPSFSQCPNSNTLVGDITPSGTGVANTQTFGAGQYMLAYVIKDANYTVTTCGTSAFDTQLTIYNDATGDFITYNDDNCGLQSTVNFTPSFCGYVRVLLHEYSCNGSGRTTPVSMTKNTDGVTPPVVTASTLTPVICLGEPAKLTGGGATTYEWTGGVTDDVDFSPTATDTYTVTGYDGIGCKSSNTVDLTVTVNSLPAVTANTTTPVVCLGESATLTGGGAVSYTWTGSVTNNVAFSPTGTNTYTVTGTDANGCENTASRTITVNTLPTVTANTTTPAICTGESATLFGGGAVSYTWTGSVTDNVAFSPTGTNTYTVTGTDANGCKNTASRTITVNTLPTVTANTSTPSICIGESATLFGGGAVSYTWTGSVTNNVAFSPTGTNTYTVTGTDANGCKNTASRTITVNNLPTVTANTTTPVVCLGESATLFGGGAVSYTWTGSVANNVAFSPTGTNTYTVTGTDANGCKNTASRTITVNTLPTVTANTTTPSICIGESATLSGGGAVSYAWTGSVTDNVSFNPTVTDTYTVTGTDANGCKNTASATITVNDLPIVTANTTTPSICIGESATLSGGGAVSYVWTGSVTDDVSFDPTVTDTYTVTGTDANGCKNTASATITVNDLPTVTANTTTPIICSGESATLSGGGAVSYVWTGSVTDNVSFDPTVTDTYTVTGTDANGCKNTASATITVNDLPSTATTVNETTITVDLAGATYQWVSDCGVSNDVLDNETGQSFTASVEGNYSVIVTENGCSATSSCIAILFTGIDDAEHSSLINIYPNPNNGSFTIHSSIGGSYKVINELGQTVDTFQLDGINDLNVDFTNIKNGMYMLVRIDNPDNRTISKKIVISR